MTQNFSKTELFRHVRAPLARRISLLQIISHYTPQCNIEKWTDMYASNKIRNLDPIILKPRRKSDWIFKHYQFIQTRNNDVCICISLPYLLRFHSYYKMADDTSKHVDLCSVNIRFTCEIWGFHGGEDNKSRSSWSWRCELLCRMSTFRRSMLPPSSGYINTILHGITTDKTSI